MPRNKRLRYFNITQTWINKVIKTIYLSYRFLSSGFFKGYSVFRGAKLCSSSEEQNRAMEKGHL